MILYVEILRTPTAFYCSTMTQNFHIVSNGSWELKLEEAKIPSNKEERKND